jgi:hypothetical protein
MMDDRFAERFFAKIDIPDDENDCWTWLACKNALGYGNIGLSGHILLAHRASYELLVGTIPDGMCILHSCDNPSCVNPNHLRIGTRQDNMDDKVSRGRCSCLRGENAPNAKLTQAEVDAIRLEYTGAMTQTRLAAKYGVTQMQIGNIVNNRSWVVENY